MGNKKEEPSSVNEPEELKGDGVKTTKISNLKDVIKERLEQLKDLATMEVLLPIDVRMKKRLESIRKMSSAESWKISGHWKTKPPEIHISGLEGRKHNESEAEVRFSVYQTDDKGNKKLYEHYSEEVRADGSKVKRLMSAEYQISYDVVERILYRKPITREIIYVGGRPK